ncbi:unnamed protein product [Didymodactylos carnosus]|uniref:SOCS box domain-containing protein n=1 Tax=Didymodactylos carnosus TaxID=1234261 RepID=A0A813PIM0_9BILA|nr:unnamed protein product [Didymodactylos carnosus]CAF0820130.1 unnamed protein product [Didymodactylos carnosus]CAF3530863.1 unnamed protein product [Didymodactylos carnosus]CAF3604375.1 unnamed protein product [Didymodactylos carnosus]
MFQRILTTIDLNKKIMLNKARSLLSRVFSLENRPYQSKDIEFFDEDHENSDDSNTGTDGDSDDSESDDYSDEMENNELHENISQQSNGIKSVKSMQKAVSFLKSNSCDAETSKYVRQINDVPSSSVKKSSTKSNPFIGTKSELSVVSDQRSSISTIFNSIILKSSSNNQTRVPTKTIENDINDKTNYLVALNRNERKQNRLTSAMNIAFARCNVESMKRLLSNFDVDINQRDSYGMSYLEHSILIGSYEIVDLLIRYGCDLYQGDSHGHSYLYVAIETTSNKNDEIIKLLLENDCSCLRLMDIVSLVSLDNLSHINSSDFLQLSRHILLIMTYHLKRMALNDVLSLLTYMISTGILLCKNDDIYGLSECNKQAIERFNNDYIQLFVKILGSKHALKLEQKLRSVAVQQWPSTSINLIPLALNDIQICIVKIYDMIKQPNDLKHFCRLIIRQNLKNLKSSTLNSLGYSAKLQEYLLYSPI